jgi:hypothetical protein
VSTKRKLTRGDPRKRPGGLDRAAVAESVHQAVCLVSGGDGTGHCVAYAFAGAVVLSVTTGQQWTPQAGEARFGTGQERDSPEGEVCFAYQPSATTGAVTRDGAPAAGGLANREFHAWCARGQGSEVAEVADFAARHVPGLAESSGIGWAREAIPYLWGTPQQLTAQRCWYRTDEATTNAIHEAWNIDPAYEDTARLAVTLHAAGRSVKVFTGAS